MEFEKESTSEDSQKDMDIDREDLSFKEAASDDSKHCSESENSSGHSRKTSKSENNVTVVNISVDSLSSNERDKQGSEESSRDGSFIATQTAVPLTQPPTTIPTLPKPVSARIERNKIAQALQNDSRVEQSSEKYVSLVADDDSSIEVIEEPDKLIEEPTKNVIVEEQHGHITVIQVGAASGTVEGQSYPGVPRLDNSQVLVNQRPEMKRLTIEKVPLRETRSLDDSRVKGKWSRT